MHRRNQKVNRFPKSHCTHLLVWALGLGDLCLQHCSRESIKKLNRIIPGYGDTIKKLLQNKKTPYEPLLEKKINKAIQIKDSQLTCASVPSLSPGTPHNLRFATCGRRVMHSTRICPSCSIRPQRERETRDWGRVHNTSHSGDELSRLQ